MFAGFFKIIGTAAANAADTQMEDSSHIGKPSGISHGGAVKEFLTVKRFGPI